MSVSIIQCKDVCTLNPWNATCNVKIVHLRYFHFNVKMFVLWILGIATCNVKIVHLRYFHQPQALSKSNSKCFHFRLNLRTFKCPCWYYWKLLIFQTSATEQQASTMYPRWAKPTFGITCQTVGLIGLSTDQSRHIFDLFFHACQL